MLQLNDLPDDVLALVLREACAYSGSAAGAFWYSLSLLAVCKRWRHLALPAVYSTAFIRYQESGPGDRAGPAPPSGGVSRSAARTTNMGAIAASGTARMVRRVEIDVAFEQDPLHGFWEVARLMGKASSEWGMVRSLRIEAGPESSYYVDRNHPAGAYESEIQGVGAALAMLMPGVRSLEFHGEDWSVAITALKALLVDACASQLRVLRGARDIELPEGVVLNELRALGFCGVFDSEVLFSRVRPDIIERLEMDDILASHEWPAFAAGGEGQATEFPRLRTLKMRYSEDRADADVRRESRRVLRLPSLEHFGLVCSAGHCSFLAQAEFPREVASMDVHGSAGVLEAIASMPVAATRRITLGVDSWVRDPGVFNHINRILEKCRGCTKMELRVDSVALDVAPEHMACTTLTSLRIAASMTVDTMVGLIQKLPCLVDLKLRCVTLNGAWLDIPVPGPHEPTPAPLSTSIVCLEVRYYGGGDSRMDKMIRTTEHLLLRIPTLASFASFPLEHGRMADFVRDYSRQCPSIARVEFRVLF